MGWCGEFAQPILTIFGGTICFIIFNILLVLKIDGGFSFAWYFVFIPLWVGYIFYSWFVLWLFFGKFSSVVNAWGAGIWLEGVGFCLTLWTILLSVKLEVSSWNEVNWAWIFVPFWTGLLQLLLVDSDWPVWKNQFHKKPRKLFKRYYQILPRNVVIAVMLFGLIVVLLRQDIITVGNWALYFAPFWFIYFLLLCICCVNISDSIVVSGQLGSSVVFPFIVGLLFFLFLILLVLYLQGIVHLIVYSFIPLWILEILGVIGSCTLCCN